MSTAQFLAREVLVTLSAMLEGFSSLMIIHVLILNKCFSHPFLSLGHKVCSKKKKKIIPMAFNGKGFEDTSHRKYHLAQKSRHKFSLSKHLKREEILSGDLQQKQTAWRNLLPVFCSAARSHSVRLPTTWSTY